MARHHCSDFSGRFLRFVLTQSLDGPVDSGLERGIILQVFADLLDLVSVEDHANDATCALPIDRTDLRVKMLTQELLLGIGVANVGDHFSCDGLLLLLCGNRHCHGHALWNWHCYLLDWLLLSAAEGRETGLVDFDALLGLVCAKRLLLLVVVLLALVVLIVVLTVLLVLSLYRGRGGENEN